MLIRVSYGFTLIEVLLVLSIFSVLTLIIIPVSFTSIEKQQEKKFLETFEYDILSTQSLAATTQENVKIIFNDSHYEIVKGRKESTLITRNIPENIKVKTRLRRFISFEHNGRIQNPERGRMEIETPRAKYHVIFPLGKGRCSIVKK